MPSNKKTTNTTESIGLRIKKARKKILKKSVEFARAKQVSASTLADWESGRAAFTADQLNMIAGLLDVDPAWLLTGRKELAPDWLGKNKGKISEEE